MATAGQHAQPPTSGNGTAPITGTVIPPKATAPPTPIQAFRGLLDKMKGQIEDALPTHVDAARFFRVVLTTIQQTPELITECTRESLFARLMQCAALGLEPDGLLGHAHLVPRRNSKKNRKEVTLVIGYKGLIKLARQSGEVTDVSARVVYEKDYFDYEYGLNERLVHRPYMVQDPEDEKEHAGPVVYIYAIFRFKDGHHFEVMNVAQIERIRKQSDFPNSPAWVANWDWMAKKTVIRQAAKLSPASVEDKMARAIALDERAEAGLPQDVDGSGSFIEDGDKPAGQVPSAPQANPSSLQQRKTIVKLAGEARITLADVCNWHSRAAVDDLTREEADVASARLTKVIEDGRQSIAENIR